MATVAIVRSQRPPHVLVGQLEPAVFCPVKASGELENFLVPAADCNAALHSCHGPSPHFTVSPPTPRRAARTGAVRDYCVIDTAATARSSAESARAPAPLEPTPSGAWAT